MAVNQNGFNSRITSEALEERFRQVFPAQGGSELIADLYASGVIVPTIDFTSVAEGSFLPESLQQAWDFATGNDVINNGTVNLITTPGFWLVDVSVVESAIGLPPATRLRLEIFDGITSRIIFAITSAQVPNNQTVAFEDKFVVFLRAGDTLRGISITTGATMHVWYRQVASVNGVLVNPLGFTF